MAKNKVQKVILDTNSQPGKELERMLKTALDSTSSFSSAEYMIVVALFRFGLMVLKASVLKSLLF